MAMQLFLSIMLLVSAGCMWYMRCLLVKTGVW
jgi:hypothetical protein